MTSVETVIDLLDLTSGALREADPTAWTPEQRDDVLEALGPAAIEVDGLASRIRAAKVNDTPVPRPAPARRTDPPPTEPAAPPASDPPPSPPPGGGGS